MTRSWSIVVIAAVAAMVVAGCGQGAGEEPSGPKPPDSTLTFGNRSVSGVLGSYCWTSPSGATCADAAGIPVPPEEQALAVPAGSVMIFDFGGSRRPTSVRAVAYPLGRGNELSGSRQGGFLVPSEGRLALATENLKVRRKGVRTEIPSELPVGKYVVELFVRVSGGNDASYYFRIAVEGHASKLRDIADPEHRAGTSENTSSSRLLFVQRRCTKAPLDLP